LDELDLVDAHTHIVSGDGDRDRYPLESSVGADQGWHEDRPVDADAMVRAAAAAGVGTVVFVQSLSCHGYDNRYAIDSARRFGHRAIAVGAADGADAGASARLRREVLEGEMRGVRLSASGTPPSFESDASRALVTEAAELGIPVVLIGGAAQLPSVARLAAAHSTVPFVLDHCGFADLREPASLPHASGLLALAEHANVACKVSSINLAGTPDPQSLWTTLVARFGSDRVLWGSDYPHSNGRGYDALVALARRTTEVLGARARADVLGGTARRLWP
jgi:predicted TIM-barrel fold metal-dependent hydrolase